MNEHEQKLHKFLNDLLIDGKMPAINLCNIIAANCGWLPLKIGESMTVGFGDSRGYTITRNADREWEKRNDGTRTD